MPFPIAITTPQKATLRASGYWQRTLVCLNPNEVVFRARANETITTAPFITFAWDSADVGAYTDVLEGMVCYISATTSIRDAKYRGRVRLAPSSTEFYIDENATILNDGDYIIVTRDCDLFARIRRDTLVDGSIPYHNLPPTIAAFPSTLVLYDSDNDGLASYTTVQTGVATASGASISSWLHTISGTGTSTFTSGTSASQNPTVRFQAGYHYLWRIRVTDSNGVQNYQFCQVYVVTRTFTAPANTAIVTGSIEHDLTNGFTASLTGYADLTSLIDRTHCAVWSIERFGDNSSTPIITNILMNGRIRSDSLNTVGSDEAGQVQQVSFQVEGIAAYLQRLRIPSDIVRASSSPSQWGEITNPNPFRMAVYAMWAYTTLTNICSFSAETGNFDAWRTGAEPVSIDGGFASDILSSILWDRIKAQPNYAPSGEIFLARNLNYLEDRSGVVTVMDFTLSDMREFTIDRDSSRVTAQVVAYGGVFNTAFNQIELYTAQSPSIVYGDAPETKELTRELLQYDSTVSEATTELAARSGNDYAFINPKPLNNVILYDSYAWLIVTNYRRYTFTIPASADTLGIAYTTSDYWFLQRVALTINADGSIDVSAEFPAETEFSDAQQLAALLPNNLENLMPVLPVLPNDPAFPTDPLELYPTDTPGIDDLQPIGNFSAGQSYMPFPPDIASEATSNQGNPKCQTLAVNFRNPNNTASSKLTVLSADYLMTLNGFTAYGGSFEETFNDANGNLNTEWSGYLSSPTYSGGVWNAVNTTIGGINRRAVFLQASFDETVFTSVIVTYSLTKGSVDVGTFACLQIIKNVTGTILFEQSYNATPNTAGATYRWDGNESMSSIRVSVSASRGSFGGAATISQIVMTGLGVNPFSGMEQTELIGDAFYIASRDDEDGFTAVLYSASEGLRIDNAVIDPADIPPYSANHKYQIPFVGTGNVINARMEFLDYSDKQNKNLQIEACLAG